MDQLQKRKETLKELNQVLHTQITDYCENPDQLVEAFKFHKQFYQYSFRNRLLLQQQAPTAVAVGSYQHWKKIGFPVKKNETGLKILSPVIDTQYYDPALSQWLSVKMASLTINHDIQQGKIKTRQQLIGMKPGYVFADYQTTMTREDYPTLYTDQFQSNTSQDYDDLIDALMAYASTQDIVIKEETTQGIVGGFYRHDDHSITLSDDLASDRKLMVLTHELGHAMLHKGNVGLSQDIKEIQAQTVSTLIMSYYDVPLKESDLGYIHRWSQERTPEERFDFMHQTLDTCVTMTTYVDRYLQEAFRVQAYRRTYHLENQEIYSKEFVLKHMNIEGMYDKITAQLTHEATQLTRLTQDNTPFSNSVINKHYETRRSEFMNQLDKKGKHYYHSLTQTLEINVRHHDLWVVKPIPTSKAEAIHYHDKETVCDFLCQQHYVSVSGDFIGQKVFQTETTHTIQSERTQTPSILNERERG